MVANGQCRTIKLWFWLFSFCFSGVVVLKLKLSLFLGILFAIFFLWFAVRDTNLSDIGVALAKANYWYVLPFIIVFSLYFIVKAVRWALLLKPVCKISIREALPATVIGYSGNLLFPAYLGEFGRAYILSKQKALNYSSVLASIFLERIWDFVTLFAFVGIILIIDAKLPDELTHAGYLISIGVTILILMLGLYTYWTEQFIKIIKSVIFFLPINLQNKIIQQLEKAPLGLQSMKQPALLSRVAIASVLHWGLMGLCLYISLLAFSIEVPYTAAFIVLVLIAAGMTLPSTPGFFGTIQICFVLGLKPYGVSADVAFAASVFFHLTMYIFTLLIGFYYFRNIGMTLNQIREESVATNTASGS